MSAGRDCSTLAQKPPPAVVVTGAADVIIKPCSYILGRFGIGVGIGIGIGVGIGIGIGIGIGYYIYSGFFEFPDFRRSVFTAYCRR